MTAVARAISVEFGSDFEEPFQAEDRQVGGLGKASPEQAVGVLVRAALPGLVGSQK